MRYIILFLLPLVSLANIDITEIMFDPEGTDGGREWIEVYNKSDESIDLSTWKVLENGINHGIKGDSSVLGVGEYAVIADNVDKFIIDYPTYSGILLDSAFGLNNTGESLALVDGEGNQHEYIEYDVTVGEFGNGNTLSLVESGEYIANPATPGLVNEIVAGSTTSSTESTHSSSEELTKEEEVIDLKIGAGRKRVVTINTPIGFKAITNTDVRDKDVRFTFGDGHARTGIEETHSYEFPGVYNVVIRGKKGDEEAVSRTTVTVFIPDLSISEVNILDRYIVLENNGHMEVNLGGFKLKGPDLSFRFPKDTIISPKSQLYLSFNTLWLLNDMVIMGVSDVSIVYPEGGVVMGKD